MLLFFELYSVRGANANELAKLFDAFILNRKRLAFTANDVYVPLTNAFAKKWVTRDAYSFTFLLRGSPLGMKLGSAPSWSDKHAMILSPFTLADFDLSPLNAGIIML